MELEEVKRMIANLPQEKRDEILRKFPHLSTKELDEMVIEGIAGDEVHKVLREYPHYAFPKAEVKSNE